MKQFLLLSLPLACVYVAAAAARHRDPTWTLESRTRFADSGGVRIHYAALGQGPLVVMIHGFPDFWYTWWHQMEALADPDGGDRPARLQPERQAERGCVPTSRRCSTTKRNYPREAYVDEPSPVTKVKAPVLMIHGLQDQYLLAGALNSNWEYVDSDLTLVTIPGAGHFVQQDAADLVSRTMKAWLHR